MRADYRRSSWWITGLCGWCGGRGLQRPGRPARGLDAAGLWLEYRRSFPAEFHLSSTSGGQEMTAVHHAPKISYEESERYQDVYGVKIHYNEAGSGPALICFHGGGPGANAWDNTKHNIDMLSEHFHTILFDMPGYGYSDKEADCAPGESLDAFWARVVKEFMD